MHKVSYLCYMNNPPMLELINIFGSKTSYFLYLKNLYGTIKSLAINQLAVWHQTFPKEDRACEARYWHCKLRFVFRFISLNLSWVKTQRFTSCSKFNDPGIVTCCFTNSKPSFSRVILGASFLA